MQTHLISHTHWDREWYLTYEQFRLRLVGLVDRLLDLMEADPDYQYFHLDGQTIVLEDYLELRPRQEPRLRRLIADGRILIGPWYDMPDEFLVSGESLVRNLARGHRLAASFGTPMPVGYLPDLFGHVAQMPQILRQFGLDNAILWRGFGGPRAEYWWQGPDGSRVLMMHLPPQGYCNATRVHLDPERMIERATAAIEVERARTAVGEMLLMNGVDHVEPHPIIPSLARDLSVALGMPVRHSTLPAYVDAVRAGVQANGVAATLEVVHGELRGGEDYANLLPGVFSARTYLKQANARVQTLLEKRAEPLATFAWMLGAPYPAEELAYAWKTLLQNHPHDSICGCSIDAVHEENMTRFARAEQVARAVVDRASETIAAAVPAAPAGRLRVVALNSTGHAFRGTIEATIDLPYESDEPRRVVDAAALDAPVTFWPPDARVTAVSTHDGHVHAVQVLHDALVTPLVMSRYETPWIVRARRLTLAWPGEVPACGYATFDLHVVSAGGDAEDAADAADAVPAAAAAPADQAPAPVLLVSDRSAENAYVQVAINDDGTVDVVDKRTGTRYARCGELEDVGDVGDEYNFSPPALNPRFTSEDAEQVRVTTLHAGPLRAAFHIQLALPLPESATADRSARTVELVANEVALVVTLDADSPRIGWQVSVDNRSRDHRLRLLFPLGAESVTDVRAETAFGVARRPARRAVPAENQWEVPVSYGPTGAFTEAGSATAGAIVFGDGLAEYEAVADEAGQVSRLGLTLLRCVGFLSREDLAMRPSGHAGPGLATPGAQCPGRHDFRLAFEPRGGMPSNGELFARAAAFVAPPHVVPAQGTAARLPAADAFVTIVPEGAVTLSACYRAEEAADAVTLRVFNAGDDRADVAISARGGIAAAARVDLLERPTGELPAAGGRVRLTVGAHRIETVRMVVTDGS